jgi:hypothetical protein
MEGQMANIDEWKAKYSMFQHFWESAVKTKSIFMIIHGRPHVAFMKKITSTMYTSTPPLAMVAASEILVAIPPVVS